MSIHLILIAASGAALAGFALGTAYGSRRARAAHTPPQRPRYRCSVDGKTFRDLDVAFKHATEHNAIDKETASDIIKEL